MDKLQYEKYSRKFGLYIPISLTQSNYLQGIEGSGTVVADALIQIPLMGWE